MDPERGSQGDGLAAGEHRCSGCGARLPASEAVCPFCGRDLAVSPPAATAAPVAPAAVTDAPPATRPVEPPASGAGPLDPVAATAGGVGRTGRVNERLRALGRVPRDGSNDSDTLEGHPPLASDDSPLPEIARRPPPGPPLVLPPVHPARVSWLLLLAVLVACWATGLTFRTGLSEPRLADVGGLLAQQWSEPWRLVLGTFVHQVGLVAVFTAVMFLFFGLELERRVGSGVVLFLVVVGGVALNAARVASEPPRSLFVLAGGWPAGLALGGAVLALSVLAPSPGVRRPWAVFLTLGLEVTLIVAVAQQAGALTSGLQGVLFLSVGVGLVAGLLLALTRSGAGGGGCLLGGIAVATLVAAQGERERERRTQPGPAPWEAPVATVLPVELSTTSLQDLKLSIELPDWTEVPTRVDVKCPACKREVQVTASIGKAEGTVECPECGKDGVKPTPRFYIDSMDPALHGQRWFRLIVTPRGPFDAADTLALRRGEELGNGDWASFKDVTPVASRPLSDDPTWAQESGWQSAWVLVVSGRFGDRPTVSRQYFLIGKHRTVQLITFEVDDGVTPPDQTPAAALFDAVARSARELP